MEASSYTGETRQVNSRIATGCQPTKGLARHATKSQEILKRGWKIGVWELNRLDDIALPVRMINVLLRFPFKPRQKHDRFVWPMVRYGARKRGERSGIVPWARQICELDTTQRDQVSFVERFRFCRGVDCKIRFLEFSRMFDIRSYLCLHMQWLQWLIFKWSIFFIVVSTFHFYSINFL